MSDAVAASDGERLLTEIHHDDLYFPAIIAVDSAGAVEKRDPEPRGKTTSGANLPLPPWGNLDSDSGWNLGPSPGLQYQIAFYGGTQIEPRAAPRGR